MIYGTTTKLFAKAQYNEGLQQAIVSQEGAQALNYNFTNAILKSATKPETSINTLNMQKIYIIVSDYTASASELLVNGLRPYMNVKVVGSNTVGKYVGSVTLTDDANPSDKWAMQPIIVKFANSQGVTDYVNGLTPDIMAYEDFAGLMPFGDPNETLLKAVLNDMQGVVVTAQTLKSTQMGLKKITDSRTFKRHAKDMYINPETLKGLKIVH
jgi:carboxyl-terminal processing protease